MIVNDDDGDDDRLGSYSNWIFFAEGGRHILCRNSCHNRYLLRLRKIDINTNDDDNDDSIKRILHSIRYTDIMINNWFGINTLNISNDSPRVIELLPSFKSELMISINEYRPIGRKSSSNDIHKYGTIDIDYSYLYKPINTNSNIDNNNDISIELKIKCGLKCSSPFLSCTDSNSNSSSSSSNVDTSHDIKLRYSRYGLMQLVKLGKRMTESISNPWENSNVNSFKLSSYNPSDLCSRDLSKVTNAINNLLSNPQNNFRLLHNGHHIYGWDKTTDSDMQSFDTIIKTFNNNNDDSDNNNNFVNILSRILCEEEVLYKLELLQCLDIIDIEGAFRVYERLQCLCTNEKDVIKAINDYYHPLDDWLLDIAETIHKNSDIVIGTNSINDHRSLLLALSSLRINQDTEITIRQHNYRQAHNIINDLKTDQCLFLLHIWLLALAAKDASVIITIKKLQKGTDAKPDRVQYKVFKKQCNEYAGIIANLQTDISYAYTIGLIDIDRKPVDKIWTKYNEEHNVCLKATATETYLKNDT